MANVVKRYIAKEPESYESLYYQWRNITKDKKYGGKHKGFPFDGYNHSSQNPEMIEDFQDLNMEWEYSVLYYGDDDYILNTERRILKSNDARNSDKWYNLTNGGEQYPSPDIIRIHEIVDNIKNGVYFIENDKLDETDLKRLLSDDQRHQVRTEEDISRERDIANNIDYRGDTKMCDPITLLENRNGVSKHCLIDGNTTGQGILKSKHGKYAEYNLIPYDIHKDLTKSDLDHLGLLLNPKPEKKKWESTPKDWATALASAFINESRPIRCEENKQNLLKANHGASIRRIYEMAEDIYKMGITDDRGRSWISYKLSKNRYLLDEKKQEILETNSKTMVFTFSSSKFRWEDVLFSLVDNDKLKLKEQKREIQIIIHYPKPSSEEMWNKNLTKVDGYMRDICKKYNIKFGGFVYMSKR